jgi:hypothetical protein
MHERQQGFWCGNLKERDNLRDLSTDGKIIFKWILEEIVCGGRTD